MKAYKNPEIEVVRVDSADILTASGGTETSIMPESNVIWDQAITFAGDGDSLPSLESWLFAQKK